MAFVTRCPYCQGVWLLPDKETAEKGPVRCSRCKHSFDATVNLLHVPDSLFMQEDPEEPAEDVGEEPHVAPPISSQAQKQLASLKGMMSDFSGLAERKPVTFGAPETKHERAPATPETPTQQPTAAPKPVAQPQTPPQTEAPEAKRTLVSLRAEPKSAPTPRPQSSTLAETPQEPSFRAGYRDPLQSTDPATPDEPNTPARLRASRSEVQAHAYAFKPSKTPHIILCVLLVIAIILASLVLFNQKVLEVAPSMRPFYTGLCQKVPCPSFFFHQVDAFRVGNANLVSVGSGGSYNLEVPILNNSDFAQAVPSLELRLVNAEGQTLLATRLTPSQYLTDTSAMKSVGPHKTLSVRVNLQTNVTPAQCIVNPVY